MDFKDTLLTQLAAVTDSNNFVLFAIGAFFWKLPDLVEQIYTGKRLSRLTKYWIARDKEKMPPRSDSTSERE